MSYFASPPAFRLAVASVRSVRWVVVGLVLVGATFQSTTAFAQSGAAAALGAELSTNKGCIEYGDNPVFTIGERLVAILRVDSDTASTATATVYSYKPNNYISIFSLGSIVTNQYLAFAARVGSPIGIHTLRLKGTANGVTTYRSCSFNAVAASPPGPSATPTMTRTPTNTPTLNPTPPTATPAAALRPHITTNRGCRETGDDPIFVVGEPITVTYDVASNVRPSVNATIYDHLADGYVSILAYYTIATNRSYSFSATVGPPTGIERLRLRASAYGVSSASSSCSFSVIPKPTRTRTATRTTTPTRTPTPG